MLEVAGGSKDEVGDTQRQYTSIGTVGADTREIGVPVTPGEGRSGAVSDPDLDSLRTV